MFEQVELPLENNGLTQSLESLVALAMARKKPRGPRRTYKPNLKGLDLNEPLFPELVLGIESSWESDGERNASRNEVEAYPQGCFKNLKDYGRNHEFATLSDRTICLLAANLLHLELSVLMREKGNADEKRMAIDWLFAETYSLGKGEWVKKPMHMIPFTAQFCCLIEEIDYEDLCEALHQQIDWLRERQADAAKQTSLTLGVPPYGAKITQGDVWSQLPGINERVGYTADLVGYAH